MRALVLVERNRLEMKRLPVPAPGPADVLIRVESCAVCRSDLVSLLATGRVSLAPLVSHAYPLGRFEEAIATFRERAGGAVKVVLRPQE